MDDDDRKAWKSGLAVASVGIELGVSIVVGLVIGMWLDRRLDTEPFLTYGFLALGVAAGFRSVWRTARRHWPKD